MSTEFKYIKHRFAEDFARILHSALYFLYENYPDIFEVFMSAIAKDDLWEILYNRRYGYGSFSKGYKWILDFVNNSPPDPKPEDVMQVFRFIEQLHGLIYNRHILTINTNSAEYWEFVKHSVLPKHQKVYLKYGRCTLRKLREDIPFVVITWNGKYEHILPPKEIIYGIWARDYRDSWGEYIWRKGQKCKARFADNDPTIYFVSEPPEWILENPKLTWG